MTKAVGLHQKIRVIYDFLIEWNLRSWSRLNCSLFFSKRIQGEDLPSSPIGLILQHEDGTVANSVMSMNAKEKNSNAIYAVKCTSLKEERR